MSEQFTIHLHPLYLDATKIPDIAIRPLDISADDTDKSEKIRETCPNSRIIESEEKISLKNHPLSAICVVNSNDPNSFFHVNGTSYNLGVGRYSFYTFLTCFATIEITHKGPCELQYYLLPINIRSALTTVDFNFFIDDALYAYSGGTIWDSSESIFTTLKGIYKHQYIKGTTKSSYVHSNTIATLQSHPDMHNYAINWEKNYVRHSNPPCILVKIDGTEEAEISFRNFAESICPDIHFSFSFDSIEIERPQSEIDAECQESLNMQLQEVQLLIDNDILSYESNK